MSYLIQLFLILLLTKIGAHIAQALNQPSVIGELLVGVLAGPAVFHILAPTTFTHYLSNLGVIVLMFIAGLEGDFPLLMKYWRPALTIAVLGVIFPTGAATLLAAWGFGYSWRTALFIGLVLSATSVSITVAVLQEMGQLNSRAGAMILGAAVADDIICVILLGLCISLTGGGHTTNSWAIVQLIAPKLLFFAIAFVLAKWAVPPFISFFTRLNASENDTAMALILCFGFAALAVSMGMSDVLGAYVAGLALSETPICDQLVGKIEPIGYGVFIPVFFVGIGLNISFHGLAHDWFFILALIIIAILGKQIGCGLGARFFGLPWQEASVVGAGMVSRGEMALVVANVALQAHVVNTNHYTALILVTVITTLIAPLLLKALIEHQQHQFNEVN